MIYSVDFASGSHTGTGAVPIWTVPSDATYVVRDVVILHNDTVSHRLDMYVEAGARTSHIVSEPAVVGKQTLHWDGRQVLNSGDVLTLLTDCPTIVYYRVSGYRLV